tara:strand:+ start:4630 stop:11694 length:7065 start_codon:yes stop_codon:yes gene_type:complete
MSEEDKRDNFIRGMSSRMEAQQIGQGQQDLSQYEAGLIPPIPEPPQTFVIECNKSQAQQDGDALRTNAWTNTFPPLKLKKGDVVSVNSAFLSTRGSGDLLQFDDSNNKMRMLFEYYSTNDNANNKRPDYNILGNVATADGSYRYDANQFTNCYPANYRPMLLKRLGETYKTIEDFTPAPAIPATTGPALAPPFYSQVEESYWGYKNSSDLIYDGVEDKYADGLYRAPIVSVRELTTYVKDTTPSQEPIPNEEALYGKNLNNLTIWYVSTPMSKIGPCSDNATMRIYFAYGSDAPDATITHKVADTTTFLKLLRVGENIQFKQTAWWAGERATPYQHLTTAGAVIPMKGSNAFYCGGYASNGQGIVKGSNTVDKFIQMGHDGLNVDATSQVGKYNNMSMNDCLGQIMKIVSINIGNFDRANKDGSSQLIHSNYAEMSGADFGQFIPFIEVQAPKGMSLAFCNPNFEHPDGIPTFLGPKKADGTFYQGGINERFHSQPNCIKMRTWYAGANTPLTRVPKTDWTATTNATDIATSSGFVYPTDKKIGDKHYLGFRPYFYSPLTSNSFNNNCNSSYCMNLIEDSVNSGNTNESVYTNALGITSGPSTIVATNYNYKSANKDGSLNPTSSGYDVRDTLTYSGAKTPKYWNTNLGYNASGYTEPDQSITRTACYNEGQEWWNSTSVADNGGASGVAGTGGFYGGNAVSSALVRQANYQSRINPNGDLYLKNEKGKAMLFYFTEDIPIDGHAYSGEPLGTMDLQLGYDGKTADMISGGQNYIVGIKNMVKSKYSGVDSSNNPIESLPPDGIFYGYKGQYPTTPALPPVFNIPLTQNNSGPDTGIRDLRYPIYQMNTEVYARFTNQSGESEVMYVKFIPWSVERLTNYDKVGAVANSMDNGPIFTTHQSALLIPTNGEGEYATDALPCMTIIQRDVEKTGKKAFNGTTHLNQNGGSNPFTPNDYSAINVPLAWDDKTHKYGEFCSYFEILNGFGLTEHKFEFDDVGRDLIPLGDVNFTDNGTYTDNFGLNSNAGDPAPRNVACGGDWYLCKYPNMPMKDGNDIVRMTDNQVRLTPLVVKRGEPTTEGFGNNSSTGKYNWITHYDYMDLSLAGDKTYFSPTDIANLLTKQLHKPADIYKSWDTTYGGGGRFEGGYWKESAGKYPMNAMFRVIHGPSSQIPPDEGHEPPIIGNTNDRDSSSGMLGGTYHEGDFCFFLDMTQEVINNGINAYGYTNGRLMGYADAGAGSVLPLDSYHTAPVSGQHFCWITNGVSFLNTIPSTDSYQIQGYSNESDLDARPRTFMDNADYRNLNQDSNINYQTTSTFGPQFIGTNNAQLNYNTDVSRFEWKFLHQPVYSEFQSDSSGNTSGGNIVAKIWGQAVQGYDNWDRYGGVNVVNWCMPNVPRGNYKSRRDTKDKEVLTVQDPVANAFMNKLGFSDNWISTYVGSTDYNDCKDYEYSTAYQPLGTTASDLDTSEARPYTQTNTLINQQRLTTGFRTDDRIVVAPIYNTDTPPVMTNKAEVDASKLGYLQNDTTKMSLGGKKVDTTNRLTFSGANPFGIEINGATGSTPADGGVKIKELGATLGYGMVNTLATPQAVIYKITGRTVVPSGGTTPVPTDPDLKVPTDLNLDDVKFPNYEIEVDSNSLLADELPKKTLIGYFLIMSDIIDKHEFIGSANGGQPLKCIGILSKNYSGEDFYYSFQSPVEFHVKQDRTITSIKTTIVEPNLNDPPGLDFNSSIIYSIVRQQSLPEPDVPPLAVQQALDYATMEKMTSQLGVDMKLFNPLSAVGQMGIGNSGGGSLNSLRQNLVSAVLNPSPNQASIIGATESAMTSVVSRMPLHERGRAILNAGMGDPSEALRPSPAQASMEGLGIAQPTSLTPTRGLSEEQLVQEHLGMIQNSIEPMTPVGKKGSGGPADSAMGSSIGDDDPYQLLGGGSVPFDPVQDDDDMKSYRSSLTKDNELYSQIDQSELGSTPQQNFIASAGGGKAGLPSIGLPEYFAKYMSVANDSQRQFYRNEADQYGFSVDNPNVWRLGLLRTWDKGLGGGIDKMIGAKLNIEGTTKISMAKNRYEALDRPAQKEQRGKELEMVKQRGEDPTSLVIPQPEFGQEGLVGRVSRSQPLDPRTRADQKHLRATDWTGQNPYDLRTWSQGNLQAYQVDLHHGVKISDRTPDNKLNERGLQLLSKESSRRRDGNKRALQLTGSGDYKKTEERPTGYDPLNRHKSPHISIGITTMKRKSTKDIKGKRSRPIKSDRDISWSDGYLKGHALKGGLSANEFYSHENAIKEYRKHAKGKVSGITKYNKKGQTVYSLRAGHDLVKKAPKGEKSYMFHEQPDTQPQIKQVEQMKPIPEAPKAEGGGGPAD